MKLSARNVLNGTIKRIVTGAVNSEIVVDLGNGIEITSIITKTSEQNLKLEEGEKSHVHLQCHDAKGRMFGIMI